MTATTQRVCVWCGLAMATLWLIGFLIAGFIPPPSPKMTPQELADMFGRNNTRIRSGLLLLVIGAALLGPFVAVLSVQMKRIEGTRSPLTFVQLGLGSILVLLFILPTMVLQGAAYRPGRPPDQIQAMSDIAWLTFIGAVSTVFIWQAVVGIVILQDRQPIPLFPRWAGYLCLWVALFALPGALCVFFTDGPFAWDGLFSWWIPLSTFGIWLVVMTRYMLRAVHAEDAADGIGTDRNLKPLAPAIVAADQERESERDHKVELLIAEVDSLRKELADKA